MTYSAQNADDYAHFAYYDSKELLSFVWNGGPQIQVCAGGYGEPPADTIDVDPTWKRDNVTLEQFESVCRNYLGKTIIPEG